MFPSVIARELQTRGYDTVSVHESPGRGSTDEQVFDFAQAEARAIVTENIRDFRPLANMKIDAGGTHAGLIFTTGKRWPRTNLGALISALEQLLASTSEQPNDAKIWL
jgi:predicted nuclease of predicted toxin-antitoxin system